MAKKSEKTTTIQDKKAEKKSFQGGYVPPPMKVQDKPKEQKGYLPPPLKPPSAPSKNPPPTPSKGGGKPDGGKTA